MMNSNRKNLKQPKCNSLVYPENVNELNHSKIIGSFSKDLINYLCSMTDGHESEFSQIDYSIFNGAILIKSDSTELKEIIEVLPGWGLILMSIERSELLKKMRMMKEYLIASNSIPDVTIERIVRGQCSKIEVLMRNKGVFDSGKSIKKNLNDFKNSGEVDDERYNIYSRWIKHRNICEHEQTNISKIILDDSYFEDVNGAGQGLVVVECHTCESALAEISVLKDHCDKLTILNEVLETSYDVLLDRYEGNINTLDAVNGLNKTMEITINAETIKCHNLNKSLSEKEEKLELLENDLEVSQNKYEELKNSIENYDREVLLKEIHEKDKAYENYRELKEIDFSDCVAENKTLRKENVSLFSSINLIEYHSRTLKASNESKLELLSVKLLEYQDSIENMEHQNEILRVKNEVLSKNLDQTNSLIVVQNMNLEHLQEENRKLFKISLTNSLNSVEEHSPFKDSSNDLGNSKIDNLVGDNIVNAIGFLKELSEVTGEAAATYNCIFNDGTSAVSWTAECIFRNNVTTSVCSRKQNAKELSAKKMVKWIKDSRPH